MFLYLFLGKTLKHFIKICGITSVEDAQAVHLAGADAIGLMMYKNSSRYLELHKAKEIYDFINNKLIKLTKNSIKKLKKGIILEKLFKKNSVNIFFIKR